MKFKFEPGDLDLNFEVTKVIQGDNHVKDGFTQYLKKYLIYPHQIRYTEVPGQDEDEIRTG